MRGRLVEKDHELNLSQQLPLLRHLVFRAKTGFIVGADLFPAEGGILILRHTFTNSVGKEMFTGQDPKNPNGKITLQGYMQAFMTGMMMKQRGIHPDLYIASDLFRARRTARILSLCTGNSGHYLPDPKLVLERRFGTMYDGQSRKDLTDEERKHMSALHPSKWHSQTGFESLGMFLLRGAASLIAYEQIYQQAHKYTANPWIVIVTHGGVADAHDLILRKHLENQPEFVAMQPEEFLGGSRLPSPYINIQKDPTLLPIPALKANPLDGYVIPGRVLKSLKSTSVPKGKDPNRYIPLSRTVDSLGLGSRYEYRNDDDFEFLNSYVIRGLGEVLNLDSFLSDHIQNRYQISTLDALYRFTNHPVTVYSAAEQYSMLMACAAITRFMDF